MSLIQVSEPKPKKNCRVPHNKPLPIILKKNNELHKFSGVFNGFNVVINDEEEMKKIISMGYFGKANLSRSFPQFAKKEKTEIIRQRQFDRRKVWGEQSLDKKSMKKVIVLPDSDSETEDYFVNLKPKYEIDRSNIKEEVWLGLEEAFFLNNAVGCLNIEYLDNQINDEELWELFGKTDPYFKENYLVYYHYRTKNWVVKPGIKFGGDFLLYKEGPPFYHASYIVIIDMLRHNLERLQNNYRRSMEVLPLLGLNRLCETAGKELLICQVILPENPVEIHYKQLNKFEIREIGIKRWISSQERQSEEF